MFFFIQIVDERISYEADRCCTYLGLKAIAGVFSQGIKGGRKLRREKGG
jgi:hypothetical protein